MKTKHNPPIINAPDTDDIISSIENIDEDMRNEENTTSEANNFRKALISVLPYLYNVVKQTVT